MEIRFKTDRNGKTIAQYFDFQGARRWIKIGLEKAELYLATGKATRYPE